MAEPKSFDDLHFEIPEDAPEGVKLHMRAQMAIQAAFYAFGDPKERPGRLSIGASDVMQVLACSLAMLLSTDETLRTRGQLREASEKLAKGVREMAQVLQQDSTVDQMLDKLGMERSRPH